MLPVMAGRLIGKEPCPRRRYICAPDVCNDGFISNYPNPQLICAAF